MFWTFSAQQSEQDGEEDDEKSQRHKTEMQNHIAQKKSMWWTIVKTSKLKSKGEWKEDRSAHRTRQISLSKLICTAKKGKEVTKEWCARDLA